MPTFPALDEEPPPRPVWRTLVMVTAGIVVVAAVGVVAVEHPWGEASGQRPVAAAPRPGLQGVGGRLLVLDFTTGKLGYTTPSGGHFDPLTGATLIGDWALLSPDETAAVTSFGQVVRMDGGLVQTLLLRPSGSWGPASRPWADHGQRLVLMTLGGGHADVRTVDLHGHQSRGLGGGAADAVGDPARDGALVMVAGKSEVDMGSYSAMPTIRLELRTPGHREVLATVADLAREIGLPSLGPYQVSARFSPDGRFVAVSLDQLGRGTSAGNGQVTLSQSAEHGMVVLRRNGDRVLSMRPKGVAWPVWSHNGRRLAVIDSGGGVTVIDVSRPRSDPRSIAVRGGSLSGCLWSPGDDRLVCDDHRADKRFILDVANARVLGPLPLRSKNRYALAWQAGKAA